MNVDLIRAQMPGDTDVTVTYRVATYSSRTTSLACTVVEHGRDDVIVGAHPHLYAIPYDLITNIEKGLR